MATSLVLGKSVLLIIVVLAPFLLFTGFPGSSPLPTLITFLVVLTSSLSLFAVSKRKSILPKRSSIRNQKTFTSGLVDSISAPEPEKEPDSNQIGEFASDDPHPCAREEEEHVSKKKQESRSQESHPELDQSMDHQSCSSEDLDTEWPCPGNADCSDDSISDEESLIEIALPGGPYVGHEEEEEEPKINLQKRMPSFGTESIFGQQCLMELLAEINEEENLIEIDISMGSIKCPRFEIEA